MFVYFMFQGSIGEPGLSGPLGPPVSILICVADGSMLS